MVYGEGMLFIPLQKLVKGKAFKVAEREDSASWYEIWVVPPLDPAEEGDAYQVRHRATVRGVSQPIDMVPLFLVPFILQALSQPTSCQEELFQEPVGHTASLDRVVGEALNQEIALGSYIYRGSFRHPGDTCWTSSGYAAAATGRSFFRLVAGERAFRNTWGREFPQEEITQAILRALSGSPEDLD